MCDTQLALPALPDMRFSDLMLLLGILTAVATPIFEDAAGFHFGSFPRPM
jgi:hypothetical protein